jgi:anion-transporting  ArsA/GET3 family ATPase
MKKQKNNARLCLLLSLLMMLFSQLAAAQNTNALKNKTPEERAQLLTSLMKTRLNLDTGQLAQIQTINLKYALKNEPIIKSDANKLTKLKQLKALQKKKEDELKKVFTAEQYKQYQAFEAEMKGKISR